MGQRTSALSFRSGVKGLWKIKNYPCNKKLSLLKKFNIYRIIQSFLWRFNMQIISYKSYINDNHVYLYVYIFMFKKNYKLLKRFRINHFIFIKKNKIKKSPFYRITWKCYLRKNKKKLLKKKIRSWKNIL